MPTTHTPHSSAHQTPLFLSILIGLATLLSLPTLAGSLVGGYALFATILGPFFGMVSYQWDDIQQALVPRATDFSYYFLAIPVFIGGCLGWYALARLLLRHSNRPYVELTTALKCNVAVGVFLNLLIAILLSYGLVNGPDVHGSHSNGPPSGFSDFIIISLLLSPTILCGLLLYKAKRYNQAGLLTTGSLPNAPFQASP